MVDDLSVVVYLQISVTSMIQHFNWDWLNFPQTPIWRRVQNLIQVFWHYSFVSDKEKSNGRVIGIYTVFVRKNSAHQKFVSAGTSIEQSTQSPWITKFFQSFLHSFFFLAILIPVGPNIKTGVSAPFFCIFGSVSFCGVPPAFPLTRGPVNQF